MNAKRSVRDLEREYPNRWLLLGEPEVDSEGNVIAGSLVLVSDDREAIWRRLAKIAVPSDAAVLFTGEPVAEGQGVIL